jgi:D-inositol-3-phosphate glycosyltransferase
LVALEAAACGTPVVAAAVGGLRSIVEHGRTGFLVEDRDPAVFAAYVEELLSLPELASEIGVAASHQAQNYTWSTAAGRLRRLYADLVSAGSPLLCAA